MATDGNHVPTFAGTLQSDGTTYTLIKVSPTTKAVKVVDAATGTASTRITAPRNGNGQVAWMGVSSADMTTLIPIATDSSGNLLIQST
jgi:hypothetical protein